MCFLDCFVRLEFRASQSADHSSDRRLCVDLHVNMCMNDVC